MMRIRLFILILALVSQFQVQAQELTVKSMTAVPMDLSASQYERKDLAGQACGLVKVQLATPGAQFEGNVIGKADYKTGEYWVYMSEGSYMLSVKHPSFIPLSVNFRDYGITGIEGKATYKLTLLMPQTAAPSQTQKLTINYTPANALVLVDSKPYQGNGHLDLTLPVGSHEYQIVAIGYGTVEGSVKLNADTPRTITEHLVATQVPESSQLEKPSPVPNVQATTQPSFVPATSQTATDKALETITVNGVSFNMVHVDGGTFQMGATSEQKDPYDDEKPIHQVTLAGYYISETEVTQALWESVIGSNPSKFKGANLPVENVTWDDCQEFIEKLHLLTGREFRLPTEAEWEYAARGGNKSRGYQYSGSNNLEDVAWYWDNSNRQTHAVKTKQSNELGVYDMSGNVREWCQDWKGGYPSYAQTNPTGPSSGSYRVPRGGGWGGGTKNCRVARRTGCPPGFCSHDIGLRLALQ